MRPIRLDMAGFAAFREPTTVDFTDAELFTLVGPTGSGKSTVLDAICFALYGSVPRWGNPRSIVNALAPSASEARVRLVFSSSGHRYVAARVVRRYGKNRVTTTHAGLERLPEGFDLAALDEGLSPSDLGEVFAGTPSEMDEAVLAAVGLPYEQFTSCVVLPQGEFAEFLHAKPAKRQEILVNLLGLHVYKQVGERAGGLAKSAEGRMEVIDGQLIDLADATDAAVADAADRLATLHAVTDEVNALLPDLATAQRDATARRDALAELDGETERLAATRTPEDVAGLAAAVTQARTAAAEAAQAVTDAEHHEEELREQSDAAGEPASLRRLLEMYDENDRVAAQLADIDTAIADATAEREAARAALTAADEASTQAEAALSTAQTEDLAAAVRQHLVAGDACPVCRQQVHDLPAGTAPPRIADAKNAVAGARTRQRNADRAVRDLDSNLAGATTTRSQLGERQEALATRLAGVPTRDAVRQRLDQAEALRRQLGEAAGVVRQVRDRHRRAQVGGDQAEQRLGAAWRVFEAARDAVAAFGPPPTDRDDLEVAWYVLAGWAAEQARTRRAARGERVAAVAAAEAAAEAVRGKLAALLAEYDLEVAADGDPAAYARAVTVAATRAEAEHRHAAQRRDHAGKLREQRAGAEREAQVARTLAQHLRANNFEAWLLAEALDTLVDGGSAILRELSGGQYDLVHVDRDFYVVDHHDADLRRSVRTLSGGETFQASLALALALSDRLSGMSTAAASLESIVLDEGFGTLDAATLDTVAATLENLAARGDRMVGVVTHVPALADRIPVRFEVTRDARSARVVRTSL